MPGSVKYLFDSDVLIRAKNQTYLFDVNPEFWGWLEEGNAQGVFFSIDKVREEVCGGNPSADDPLRTWARHDEKDSFFLSSKGSLGQWGTLSAWANSSGYKQGAIDKFLHHNSADAWLISFAMQHGGYTIVTHEIAEPNRRKSIKLPDAAAAMGVPTTSLIAVIRAHAKLGFAFKP